MAVRVGSARMDENGKAHDGKAGDQTGKEVSRQDWYLHSKGWRVIRAIDPAVRLKIADAMDAACDNADIGYDQYARDTLLKNVAPFGYNPAKTTKAVETDCSALVRVCTAYAVGGRDVIGEVIGDTRWSTANQVKFMLKTGLFDEMEGDKYQKKPDYLRRGDVLVTKTQGHTVVVLSDGDKSEPDPGEHSELRKGDIGAEVTEMQCKLLIWDNECLPKYGADGDFGAESDNAVRAFQRMHNLDVDGICGRKTWAALDVVVPPEPVRKYITITGGAVNVRVAAGIDNPITGKVVHEGDVLEYTETADVGERVWYHITDGWVSGKYAVEVAM